MQKIHPENFLSKTNCVQDTLTIAETMIKRAASLHSLASKEFPILHSDKVTKESVVLFVCAMQTIYDWSINQSINLSMY